MDIQNRNSNKPDCKYDFNKPPKHKKKFGKLPQKDASEDQMQQEPEKVESVLREVQILLKDKEDNSSQVRDKMREISKRSGILRVSLTNSLNFEQNDLDAFFSQYGKIQKIKIFKNTDQHSENTAYIFYNSYYSAVLALRVIQSVPDSAMILSAKVCIEEDSSQQIYSQNGKLGLCDERQFIIFLQSNPGKLQTQQFTSLQQPVIFQEIKNWKYSGIVGIDLQDKKFNVKDRILGVRCANLLRVEYMCEKASCQQKSDSSDFKLRMIINKSLNSENEVLILSNSLSKYKQAKSSLTELMAQIIEQYKNCCDRSGSTIKKDLHIRIAQKFNVEPQIKFVDVR